MPTAEQRNLPLALLMVLLLLGPCEVHCETPVEPEAGKTLAHGTPVTLRLNQTVSSAHAHRGDRLTFVVAKDVTAGSVTAIPAGSKAAGTIIDVKHKRPLGMGGSIVFELDSVELPDGQRIGLQARQKVKGRSRTKLMAAAMIATSLVFWPATPIFLLVRGSDSTALKGSEVTGRLKDDVLVQSASASRDEGTDSQLQAVMNFAPSRVVNREGREGDPVNLMFVGKLDDLKKAFELGGWIQADNWKPVMAWHLLRHITHDARLPMARFYMFGRIQDFAYALPDPKAVVSRRHHLRIWKTDYEVDGNPVWAGSATHDVAIELAKHGRLINHRIDPDVDAERDFVGENLATTALVTRQEYVSGSAPIFEAQTVSGETYYSDSRVLLVSVRRGMQVHGEVMKGSRSAP